MQLTIQKSANVPLFCTFKYELYHDDPGEAATVEPRMSHPLQASRNGSRRCTHFVLLIFILLLQVFTVPPDLSFCLFTVVF